MEICAGCSRKNEGFCHEGARAPRESVRCGERFAWGGGKPAALMLFAGVLQGLGQQRELRSLLPGELCASVRKGLPSLLLPPGPTGKQASSGTRSCMKGRPVLPRCGKLFETN